MKNNDREKELRTEIVDCLRAEAMYAIAKMYAEQLWEAYSSLIESGGTEFKLNGAHSSEWIECNIANREVTYYSVLAGDNSSLYQQRVHIIEIAIDDFVREAQQYAVNTGVRGCQCWNVSFGHLSE